MRNDILKPTEKYGYFDVDKKEYVITRPDTPTPWINYLGFGSFGSFISNNGGGLLFDGDPGKRRLTRYRYNAMPVDRPGRYIYIKDKLNVNGNTITGNYIPYALIEKEDVVNIVAELSE